MPSWSYVALRNMRIPDYAGSYSTSYAVNDDTWWGRSSVSAYRYHAQLVQGRYPNPDGFNVNINPDYGQLSYLDSSYTTITWSRMNQWTHMMLGDTYGLSHLPGFVNNTRVLIWGSEVWIKSKATGLWTRRINENPLGGDWFSPSFRTWIGNKSVSTTGYKVDAETGYASIKLPMAPSASGEPDYWLWHGFTSQISIDPYDVADVVSSIKCSLKVDDPDGTDDREFSRFLIGVGSDYMPDEPRSTYPSCGASRLKYVTARWPNWEYRVLHTMTQAQLEAANGYPVYFDSFPEGDDPGPGDVDPPAEPIIVPSVGAWGALTSNGAGAWGTSSATGSPYVSGGLPPPLRRRR